MTAVAWFLLGVLVVVSMLLTVSVGGNADLARQNRALRRENSRLRHPSRSILPGTNPIFDGTLAEIRGLDETTPGGVA